MTDFTVDDAHPNKRTIPLEVEFTVVTFGLTKQTPEEPEIRFSKDWTAVPEHTELRHLRGHLLTTLLEIIILMYS